MIYFIRVSLDLLVIFALWRVLCTADKIGPFGFEWSQELNPDSCQCNDLSSSIQQNSTYDQVFFNNYFRRVFDGYKKEHVYGMWQYRVLGLKKLFQRKNSWEEK